jgi:hypothetical protein
MIRSRFAFVVGLVSCAWACSGDPEQGATIGDGGTGNGDSGAGGAGNGEVPPPNGTGGLGFNDFPIGDGGTGGSENTEYVEQNLIELRIEPLDAELEVPLGESRTLAYKAYGRYAVDPDVEV